MSNFSFAPGRVKYEKVLITKSDGSKASSDVTALVGEVNIFSSLIDPATIGNFYFYDAINFLSGFPIEAGDIIELFVSYPDVQKQFKFYVEKIEDIIDNQKERTYCVKGIGELGFRSFYTNISRHFKGTPSDIALQIFKDNTREKFGLWDASLGGQSLIVPYWNPIKTIKWLARRSTSIVDTTRFHFWQDSNQIYHFAPIERMRDVYKKQNVQKFVYGRLNFMQGQDGSKRPNSEASMETIEEITYHDAFDIRNQIDKGKLGGIRFQTDLTTKTVDIVTFNYWNNFKKDKSLNGNPSWPRNDSMVNGSLQFDTVARWIANDIELNKINDISNIRYSTLDQSQYIDIVVQGNQVTDVGHVVQIDIVTPAPRTEQTKDILDQRWSGKYFVIAKRDMYSNDGHKMALTLSKESLISKENKS